jgi:hypothetical protein
VLYGALRQQQFALRTIGVALSALSSLGEIGRQSGDFAEIDCRLMGSQQSRLGCRQGEVARCNLEKNLMASGDGVERAFIHTLAGGARSEHGIG